MYNSGLSFGLALGFFFTTKLEASQDLGLNGDNGAIVKSKPSYVVFLPTSYGQLERRTFSDTTLRAGCL